MLSDLFHRNIFKLASRRTALSFLLSAICFFVIIPPILAATSASEYNVVNQNNVDDLTKTTGLAADKVQDIKNQITGATVKPEITVPAEGGTVSGQNLFIKGVASPNMNVDLIIGSSNSKTSPLMGKTTSDKYGVWTYTLGPELIGGAYTLQVTTTSNDGTVQSSESVHFNVIAGATGSDQSAAATKSGIIADVLSGNNLMIIIIVIIISITFLVAVVILSIMPYARARKSDYAERLKTWTEPELAVLSETDWRAFVKQTEMLREIMPNDKTKKNQSLN